MLLKRQTLLSNISWLGLGNLLVKPLWFVFITALCMRYLEVAEYGIMMAALALATIVVALGDLGIPQYTTREVARHPEQARVFAGNLIPFYFLVSLFTWMLLLVSAPLLHFADHLWTLLLAGVYAVALRNMEYLRTYYRAFEVMRFEAFSIWLEKLLVVALGTAGLLYFRTPAGTLLGMATGLCMAVLLNLLFLHRYLIPSFSLSLDTTFIRRTLRLAIPIGLYSLINIIYLRSGTVLLEYLEGATLTGQFSAAYRIVEALSVYPTVVIPPIFARLSALSRTSTAAFHRLAWRSLLHVTLGAIAIAGIIYLTAPPLIHLLNPDPAYAPSARYLQELMGYFPLSVAKYLLAMCLIALNRQRFLVLSVATTTLCFGALALWLIPLWQAIGLIVALTVAETLMVTVCLFYFYRQRQNRPCKGFAY